MTERHSTITVARRSKGACTAAASRPFEFKVVRVTDLTLRRVVRVWHNLWCAAQILEHILRLRRSRTLTQEVIRSAQIPHPDTQSPLTFGT